MENPRKPRGEAAASHGGAEVITRKVVTRIWMETRSLNNSTPTL